MGAGIKVYNTSADKKDFLKDHRRELISVHQWECPLCDAKYESDEDTTEEEFLEELWKQGVRRAHNNYMMGTFCQECLRDPEFYDWTL